MTYAAAPTGLAAALAAATQVNLTWTAPSGTVSGYNIYRGYISGGEATLLNSSPVSGTSYSDTTVSAGTVYYYTVMAVNAVGRDVASTSNETSALTVPAAPTGLGATASRHADQPELDSPEWNGHGL